MIVPLADRPIEQRREHWSRARELRARHRARQAAKVIPFRTANRFVDLFGEALYERHHEAVEQYVHLHALGDAAPIQELDRAVRTMVAVMRVISMEAEHGDLAEGGYARAVAALEAAQEAARIKGEAKRLLEYQRAVRRLEPSAVPRRRRSRASAGCSPPAH